MSLIDVSNPNPLSHDHSSCSLSVYSHTHRGKPGPASTGRMHHPRLHPSAQVEWNRNCPPTHCWVTAFPTSVQCFSPVVFPLVLEIPVLVKVKVNNFPCPLSWECFLPLWYGSTLLSQLHFFLRFSKLFNDFFNLHTLMFILCAIQLCGVLTDI